MTPLPGPALPLLRASPTTVVLRRILYAILALASLFTLTAMYVLWTVLAPGICIAAILLGFAVVCIAAKLLEMLPYTEEQSA